MPAFLGTLGSYPRSSYCNQSSSKCRQWKADHKGFQWWQTPNYVRKWLLHFGQNSKIGSDFDWQVSALLL